MIKNKLKQENKVGLRTKQEICTLQNCPRNKAGVQHFYDTEKCKSLIKINLGK
jgi:hypothetical protein